MKKELFCYLTFLLCVAICFVSCSDKDETIVCPIKNFTFTDVSGLALTYSGKPMLGKKVEFIPDAADATKARLILSGALVDLSDILGSVAMNSRAGITDLLKFASPGVIPGEKTTELHVTLNIDGDMVTFSGEEVDSTHVSSILFLQPVNTAGSYILYTTILFYAVASIATIMSQYSDYHT